MVEKITIYENEMMYKMFEIAREHKRLKDENEELKQSLKEARDNNGGLKL